MEATISQKTNTIEADSSLRVQSVEPTIFQKGTAKISRCWTSVSDGIERLNQYKILKPFIFGMKMQFKTICGGILAPLAIYASSVISELFGPKYASAELFLDQYTAFMGLPTDAAVDLNSVTGLATAIIGPIIVSCGESLRMQFPSVKLQVPPLVANVMFGTVGFIIPWAEEFVYRYIIQDVVLTKIPRMILGRVCPEKTSTLDTNLARLFRVTLTAALFSVSHIILRGDVATDRLIQIQAVQSFVLGLFLGAVKESRIGFFGAVGLHMTANQNALLHTLASI